MKGASDNKIVDTQIDFCCIHDPRNIQNWSGTNYFIHNSIAEQFNSVSVISHLRTKHSTNLKIQYRLSKWAGRNFYYDHSTDFCKYYAKQIESKITNSESILFTLNSQLISYLSVPNKIVLCNDATLRGIYGYYEYFSNLGLYNKLEAFRNEEKALRRADLLIYSSEWAAGSAIGLVGADPAKVRVVPFGANLQHAPEVQTIHDAIAAKKLTPVKLLFVGYDYERKGGPLAVEITRRLNAAGVSATLTMVGVKAFEELQLPPFVINGGVLRKQVPEEMALLNRHFMEAHIFVMPSQRECYGLVYAEAFAFGLPVLAIRTGGVPTIVQHGINGWLFEEHDDVDRYCAAIQELISNSDFYQKIAKAARQAYDTHLNWKAAGNSISILLNKLLPK